VGSRRSSRFRLERHQLIGVHQRGGREGGAGNCGGKKERMNGERRIIRGSCSGNVMVGGIIGVRPFDRKEGGKNR